MMGTATLKAGWRVMAFGDIAQNVAERVDPAEAVTDVYVGLEHLDPESLHLRVWGHPSDVTGQKLVFKKGDVIFGRRRAYQRKLAVADRDGICSAHAMVLRAKPKVILPEFMPFFLRSDMFMERAIGISVGSLSPTINWKTMRIQEFPLPPIEEQKRIAEILWAADEAIERYGLAEADLDVLLDSLCDELFSEPQNHVKIQSLVDAGVLAAPQDGNHGGQHPKAKDYTDSGIPFIMASNISNHHVDLEGCKFISKRQADSLRIGFAQTGDVLLSHKGTVGEVAIVPELSMPYIMLTPQVTYYRVLESDKLDRHFLYFCFKSRRFQQILERFSAQSTRAYIGITAQRQIEVPFPETSVQKAAVSKLVVTSNRKAEIATHRGRLKQLLNSYQHAMIEGVNV